MVKIRLKRLGRKKRPFYRIVVTDIRNRRDGAPLQELGFYNPIDKQLKLDKKTALEWIAKGAIPSETAKRLIDKADESGALVQLETVRKEKLSKKAEARAKADAEAKASAAEAKKAEAAAAASKPAEEAPADEAPTVEAAAEEPVA